MAKYRTSSTTWSSVLCRIFVHLLVVAVAYGYMVLGGYWFCLIEGWQSDAPVVNITENLEQLKRNMTVDVLTFSTPHGLTTDEWSDKFQAKLNAYVHDVDGAKKQKGSGWNILDGFLYAFSTVTTIGYGHLTTESHAGRIFYVFYGLIGIPLFTLAMADIGLFLEKFMNWFYVKLLQCCSFKFGVCRTWSSRKRLVPAESLLALPIVLIIFLLYTALGGLLFPLWENFDFVESFYIAFDTITTIGIGDIYPINNNWFLATVFYESVGIAIGCVAIGALSDYIKVVHHFGTDPSDCGMDVIWFGGKHMRASEFARIIAKELGSTDHEIKTVLNGLDRIINEAFIERRQSRGRNSLLGGNRDMYPESTSPLKLVNYGVQPQPSLYCQDDELLKDNPNDVNKM